MLALKMLLTVAGMLLLTTAFGLPLYALWLRIQNARSMAKGEESVVQPEKISWRGPVGLAIVACLPMLLAGSIVVVPSGMGGVRISQIEGTLPGTLYPGVHFITPLVDSVQIFDLRDHIFTAGMGTENAKGVATKTALDVQSREGLNIGLGVTVRKKVDVLIGVCCLERRYELLHADRDFDAMENHLGLCVGQTELSVHEPPMAAYGAR